MEVGVEKNNAMGVEKGVEKCGNGCGIGVEKCGNGCENS